MVRRLAFFGCLVMTLSSYAREEGDFAVGLTAGQVLLLQDVGSQAGNAVGYGLIGSYHFNQDMDFEATYLRSSHQNLSHSEFTMGINFLMSDSPATYPFLSAGVDFIGNNITNSGLGFNETGFGLYVGGGIDFQLNDDLIAGLEGRYVKAFPVTAYNYTTAQKFSVIQDFATLMVRIEYLFH